MTLNNIFKIIAGSILPLVFSLSYAENFKDLNGVTAVDLSSIRINENSLATYEVKTNYRPQLETQNGLPSGPASNSNIKSEKEIKEIDCNARRIRTVRTIRYSDFDLQGSIISDIYPDNSKGNYWLPIRVRDSNQNIENLVCKVLNSKSEKGDLVLYGNSNNTEHLYVKSSIKKVGDLYDVVLVSNTLNNIKNYAYKKSLVKVDCLNEEFRVENTTFFSEKNGNGIIERTDFQRDPKAWLSLHKITDIYIPYAAFCGERKNTRAAINEPILSDPPYENIGKFTVALQPDADDYYPSFSKRAGEKGDVTVQMIIDKHGLVESANVIKSSSYPRLDRAALLIAESYQFKIFTVRGEPTKVKTDLLIRFNLKN